MPTAITSGARGDVGSLLVPIVMLAEEAAHDAAELATDDAVGKTVDAADQAST